AVAAKRRVARVASICSLKIEALEDEHLRAHESAVPLKWKDHQALDDISAESPRSPGVWPHCRTLQDPPRSRSVASTLGSAAAPTPSRLTWRRSPSLAEFWPPPGSHNRRTGTSSLELLRDFCRADRGAHLNEQPMRLAEFALARALVVSESRQLGALDVD